MDSVHIWFILAVFFVGLATVELVHRLVKNEPFWPVLKRWLTNIFDTLSG